MAIVSSDRSMPINENNLLKSPETQKSCEVETNVIYDKSTWEARGAARKASKLPQPEPYFPFTNTTGFCFHVHTISKGAVDLLLQTFSETLISVGLKIFCNFYLCHGDARE